MTAQRYVHDILQPDVLSFTQWPSGAIYQQDSALSQTASKTVSALLIYFFDLPDPQICLQSSISGIIWDGALGIP
ncbi:hypothetical protein TNCV_2825211 [Trichonephila clavipes]|nr:hypothetical protein TNCV_2825211 [Trichonephila clavipes]